MTVQQNNHNCNDVKVAEHVDTVMIAAENRPKKLWEYMIGYIVIFLVGMIAIGIFGMIYIAWSSGNFNHIDQNTLKAAIRNDQTSPFVGISFMIAGIGIAILFGIVHWVMNYGGLGEIPQRGTK